MKIALIGASGFVGTRLIELLKKENLPLCNIDKRQSEFYPEVTSIADVRELDRLENLLEGYDIVILLAAEHRDDVRPVGKYYDVNVGGMQNVLKAMEKNRIKRLVFTSSVAVYGLNKENPTEDYLADPFNDYGKSKWQAEQMLEAWHKTHSDWSIHIIRPSVIFGERNRGNVYNLLCQIASGRFLMIGRGENKKSMAYVGNVVSFIKYLIEHSTEGYHVFNYVDAPDLTMNELVEHVSKVLNKKIPAVHFPYWIGMLGGLFFDGLAKIMGKKLVISSVRVKKFCATTQFDASKMRRSGFRPPYSLKEGLARTLEFEFVLPVSSKKDICRVN